MHSTAHNIYLVQKPSCTNYAVTCSKKTGVLHFRKLQQEVVSRLSLSLSLSRNHVTLLYIKYSGNIPYKNVLVCINCACTLHV